MTLGRAAGIWTVPWDPFVSRRHVELTWRNGRLDVRQLEPFHNPVYFRGAARQQFEMDVGEHFVIGETTFTLAEDPRAAVELNRPVKEQAFAPHELARLRYRHANQRMDVLGRLPDLIANSNDNNDLFVGLVNILLAGVNRSDVAALVVVDPDEEDSPIRTLHWDRRRGVSGDFRPSRRLILEAIRHREQSVVHVWSGGMNSSFGQSLVREGNDWAFCTPVRGDACRGWGLYVAGRFAAPAEFDLESPTIEGPEDLADDVKFAELVASILASLRQVRFLERRQASLTQFFSPLVLGKFAEEDPEVALEPRPCEVSVLFCDLRGFSKDSEQGAANLLGLLERVSKALGVMTSHILEEGGIVGDFQGDAAMGFWGWPVDDAEKTRQACLAAIGIRTQFEIAARRPDNPLAGFRVGIGIATGNAVAGKIGTADQSKIGVFGPIVNLASRLEGLCKILAAPILVDEATAAVARGSLEGSYARVRRVARVRPAGMETVVEVSELLPPLVEMPQVRDEHIEAYERALDAFIAGDWAQAMEHLHLVPPADRVKDFLTAYILQRNRVPPPGWDGVVTIETKG